MIIYEVDFKAPKERMFKQWGVNSVHDARNPPQLNATEARLIADSLETQGYETRVSFDSSPCTL
jgi:hypothetical protein